MKTSAAKRRKPKPRKWLRVNGRKIPIVYLNAIPEAAS
jgi:hypothetical protein